MTTTERSTQSELIDEYEALWAGEKVKFETSPGTVRVGLVTGRWLAGGASAWVLGLEIKYRGGSYPRRASACDLA